MKKVIGLTLGVLLAIAGVALGNPAIRHSKVSAKAASPDPTVISGPDWNADHIIDPPALLGALNILRVTSDPNGTTPALTGTLAWDTTHAQLWINIGGASWTPFVRSDGGTSGVRGLIGLIGDSNFASMGVTTATAARENNVLISNPDVVLDKIWAGASSEPLTMIDMGRDVLRATNTSTVPGFGPELSLGAEIYTLLNGFGTPSTTFNKPWIVSFAIAGVKVKQMLPASSYGTTSPALGGLNVYNFWKARMQSAVDASGRKLSLLIGYLGANDGADPTDATNVAANWQTLAAQIRTDFGSQVQFILMNMNVNTDVSFRTTTVRAQLAIAATAISGCTLVSNDNQPLVSDNIHFGADAVWSIGGELAATARGVLGLQPRKSSVVAVRGWGVTDFNKTTLKPWAYPLTQDGDVQLLAIGSMKNSGSFTAIPAPTVPASGWVSLGNSNQAMGGTQHQGFALYMRPTSQADIDTNSRIPPGAQVALANDENYAQLIDIFGPSRNPVVDGSVTPFTFSSFTSSFVAGGVTTTTPNSLVLIVMFTQAGGAGPLEAFTATNANLTGLTVVKDSPYAMSTSNYGVITVFAGYMASPGATGNTTISTVSGGLGPSTGFTVAFRAN